MTLRLFVDRIEGDAGVLIADAPAEGELAVPLSFLPVGVREGDWLSVSFRHDPGKADETRREIDSLLDSLGNAP